MQLSTAKKFAYDLLKSEKLLLEGWRVTFDDSKKRLGVCRESEKLITLSRYFIALNRDAVTHDTIRHEVAHALTPEDCDHGEQWKREARRLGATPEACADSGTVAPDADFVGMCPQCGSSVSKHRAPKNAGYSVCARCCRQYAAGRFDERFLIVWRNHKTGKIFGGGGWEKDALTPTVENIVASAFATEFGATGISEIGQISKLPEFRFGDYDYKNTPEGVFRAYLEVKLFRAVNQHRILKTFWRMMTGGGIVLDTWANTFDGGKYQTADKRVNVENLKVGIWYELIVMKNEKGFPRIQTAKTNK